MNIGSEHLSQTFLPKTFDFSRLAPYDWFEANAGNAQVVQLQEGRWEELFEDITGLGLVMAYAVHGPVSLATTWRSPQFIRYPGAKAGLCIEEEAELRTEGLSFALASVENVLNQQMASIQFFDAHGAGRMKILLTIGSDLAAFEALILKYATAKRTEIFAAKRDLFCQHVPPRGGEVRQCWSGLHKTSPDSYFPGLQNVLRKDALVVAGRDLAWRVPQWAVRDAMEKMTRLQVPLSAVLKNDVVTLSSRFSPGRHGESFFGVTYLDETTQLSLRQDGGPPEAWAVRLLRGDEESVCLEVYDEAGEFAMRLAPHASATVSELELWRKLISVGTNAST